MGFYDIDYDNLTWTNVPVLLRGAVMYAWLKCLVAPCKYVYGLFTQNRNANLYNLAHNGQVCKMQAALNDVFDSGARRITIVDPAYVDPVYLYLRAEGKPVYLYTRAENRPVYLYTRAEIYASGAAQFIVQVPAAVAGVAGYDVNRLKAIVDTYRLASKNNYSILIV